MAGTAFKLLNIVDLLDAIPKDALYYSLVWLCVFAVCAVVGK